MKKISIISSIVILFGSVANAQLVIKNDSNYKVQVHQHNAIYAKYRIGTYTLNSGESNNIVVRNLGLPSQTDNMTVAFGVEVPQFGFIDAASSTLTLQNADDNRNLIFNCTGDILTDVTAKCEVSES
ncbi:hypothetical protein QIW49_07585 [Francisellaceae bacterium CB300]